MGKQQQKVLDAFIMSMREWRKQARLGASAKSGVESGVSSLSSEEGGCAQVQSASVYPESSQVPASARVPGAVSGVLVACPVSALTWGQSALVPSVSVGMSARSAVSPGASRCV